MQVCLDCNALLSCGYTYEETVCTYCGLVQMRCAAPTAPASTSAPATLAHDKLGASVGPAVLLVRRAVDLPGHATAAVVRSPSVRDYCSPDRADAGCRQIALMCSRTDLKDNVVCTAGQVYRTAFARSDWKQRKHANFAGVLAACVFHACNVHRVPRTPVELCGMLGAEVKNMRKMVKTVQHAADAVAAEHRRVQVLNVETDLVPRYLCMLGVKGAQLNALKKACVRVYRDKKASLDNHRPETVAACLISAVLREKAPDGGKRAVPQPDVSADMIAGICGVTVSTIRNIVSRGMGSCN